MLFIKLRYQTLVIINDADDALGTCPRKYRIRVPRGERNWASGLRKHGCKCQVVLFVGAGRVAVHIRTAPGAGI